MKKIALLLIVGVATLTCCKKAKDAPSASEIGLASKWELRKMVGGIWGTLNYQPGNGQILEFKSDNSFAYSEKDTIYQSGTYDLQYTSQKDQYLITFHWQQINMQEESWNAMVIADSLGLSKPGPPECCDVISYYKYVRIN